MVSELFSYQYIEIKDITTAYVTFVFLFPLFHSSDDVSVASTSASVTAASSPVHNVNSTVCYSEDYYPVQNVNDMSQNEHYIYVTYPPELKRRLLERYFFFITKKNLLRRNGDLSMLTSHLLCAHSSMEKVVVKLYILCTLKVSNLCMLLRKKHNLS